MNKAIFIFPLIILSLLTAIWGGWIRMGWAFPVSGAAAQHGALMVGSFLATLIFLERAVTFDNKAVLLLPLINGLSVVAFAAAQPSLAVLFLTLGAAGFLAMCGYFIHRYKELYYYVFFAGAFCLLAGNMTLYRTFSYPDAVPWWMGFLLFTIVAERLELSRFLNLTRTKRILLLAALALVFAGVCWPSGTYGNVALATGLTATALWLLRYDMARKSLKVAGQHRYSALLLMVGYVWLLITAFFLITASRFAFGYDAALHSFFIGFVFSMIFSHAPIILPAVLKRPIKLYRPVLYVWFVLLQASLLVRIWGDVAENITLRKWGGMINGLVLLIFFATVATTANNELKQKKKLRKT